MTFLIKSLFAAAFALTFTPSARSAEAPPLPDIAVSRSSPGWTKQSRSLLLYDNDGALSAEIGLIAEETATVSKEVRGGASPDRRAAWTLERKQTWNLSRTKLLESRRKLKIHGSAGQLLWSDDDVDWPEIGEPVVFSDDSKVVLIARRVEGGWNVEARDWTGGMVYKAGPFARLVSIGLAPGGRYAFARWAVPDVSDTHTFLDLKDHRRKDVETSELTLGLARIGDDGVVRSGRREVYSFAEPPVQAPPARSP